MSTLDENKAVATRFLALVAEHDIDALCEMVTPAWTTTLRRQRARRDPAPNGWPRPA
jgi:hypothetical protein